MVVNLLVKFVFSIIEAFSFILLSLTIFRIPVKYSLARISIISVVISLITLLMRDVFSLEEFSSITGLISNVILFTFILNLPFVYSLLVCIIGYLAFGFIQTIIVFLGVSMGFTTNNQLQFSLPYIVGSQFITSVVVLLAVWIMEKKKLGFMFIMNRFNLRNMVTSYNVFIASVFIITSILLQISIITFNESLPLFSVLIGIVVALIIIVIITYKKNVKEIEERFERIYKR